MFSLYYSMILIMTALYIIHVNLAPIFTSDLNTLSRDVLINADQFMRGLPHTFPHDSITPPRHHVTVCSPNLSQTFSRMTRSRHMSADCCWPITDVPAYHAITWLSGSADKELLLTPHAFAARRAYIKRGTRASRSLTSYRSYALTLGRVYSVNVQFS